MVLLTNRTRAVAQQGVDAAGVVAAGVDRREGRPAVLLVHAVQVEVHARVERPADDRLVGRPGRREPRGVDVAVGPLGVELELVLGDADAVVVLGGDRGTGLAYGLGMLFGLLTEGSVVNRQFDEVW